MEQDNISSLFNKLKENKYLQVNTSEKDFQRYLYGKYFEYCKWKREYFQTSYKSDTDFLFNWTNPLYIEAINYYISFPHDVGRRYNQLYNAIIFKDYVKFFTGFDEYVSKFMRHYDDFAPKIEIEFYEKHNDGSNLFRLPTE